VWVGSDEDIAHDRAPLSVVTVSMCAAET